MKKLVYLMVTGLLFAVPAKAQVDMPHSVSLNVGTSLIGDLIRTTLKNDANVDENVTAKVTPAFQLNYDYRITNVISLGLAFSYQSIGAEVSNHQYTDGNGNVQTETYKVAYRRTNIGFRPLFHYGNMERIDMYSGLRLGYTMWNFKEDSNDPNNDPGDDAKIRSRFAPQLILFGMKGYFTEHIGANFEFAIGAPHYASGGLCYRF
jgi:hypothetical protein